MVVIPEPILFVLAVCMLTLLGCELRSMLVTFFFFAKTYFTIRICEDVITQGLVVVLKMDYFSVRYKSVLDKFEFIMLLLNY